MAEHRLHYLKVTVHPKIKVQSLSTEVKLINNKIISGASQQNTVAVFP